MRTFIALDMPASFQADLVRLARQLSMAVEGRFMKRDTYHLTLAFLGETDEATIRGTMPIVDALAEGRDSIWLHPEGLGKFGRASDATLVLMLQQTDPLMRLAQDLRDQLAACGVAFDGKKFKPHITLARRARIPKGSLTELAFPAPARATSLTLYKSTLAPEGATYKPLHTVEL